MGVAHCRSDIAMAEIAPGSAPYSAPITDPRAIGSTRATSSAKNAPDLMNTAKWPLPRSATNALLGARIEFTNAWRGSSAS